MKFVIGIVLTFLILIGGGLDFIRSAINSPKLPNIEAKKNLQDELNRKQAKIEELELEIELLKGVNQILRNSKMNSEELKQVQIHSRNEGIVTLNINGNLVPCINTGISLNCN